jgi:hypothetical protein
MPGCGAATAATSCAPLVLARQCGHDAGVVGITSIAASLPNVARGLACAGTALESQTFTVNGKAFLFVSKKEARLKLCASAPQAKSSGFDVGASGWVKIPLTDLPAVTVLKKWVAESHASMSPAAKATRAAPRKQAARKTTGKPAKN